MRRCPIATIALAVAAIPAVAAAAIDRSDFRYVRTLSGPAGALVSFEPDAPLLAHARPGLADLRILDAGGRQVPWRPLPARPGGGASVTLLNVGRRQRVAVALLDLGPRRSVHDRIVLDVPERRFVGQVTVLGADRRTRPFTRLGTTTIYDVSGARRARSTVALFSPSDLRYLSLRATGISRIAGVRVPPAPTSTRFVERRARTMTVRREGRRTLVTVDLGHRVPVEEVRIRAATPHYDRPVEILASNDGRDFGEVGFGRIFAFRGSMQAPVEVRARRRYVRIAIENGDDEPLRALRVRLYDVSRAVLLEGGHVGPYRILYGNASGRAPTYDFARLPESALELEKARRAALGPERRNSAFEASRDTRSFAKKHDWVVEGALALAAVVVGAAGLLALRRRA